MSYSETPFRPRVVSRVADLGGVFGAIFAALCCAGTPFIVAGLSAVGFSFLRRDSILWPLMLASLLLALWGFWGGVRLHRRRGPLILAVVCSIGLTAGVIFVHGFPAMQMIWSSVAGLVVATLWNLVAKRSWRRLQGTDSLSGA
jgi:mercuric ion transport protein